jgi:hypothetical protein
VWQCLHWPPAHEVPIRTVFLICISGHVHTDLHVQTYCLLRSTEATLSLQFVSSAPVKCDSYHLCHFYWQLTIRRNSFHKFPEARLRELLVAFSMYVTPVTSSCSVRCCSAISQCTVQCTCRCKCCLGTHESDRTLQRQTLLDTTVVAPAEGHRCLTAEIGLNYPPVHLGFVVDTSVMFELFIRALRCSSVSIMPPMLHTHSFVLSPRLYNRNRCQRS